MAVVVVLSCVALLLTTSVLAVGIARSVQGRLIAYGVSLVASLLSFSAGLSVLIGMSTPSSVVLPLGLPWLGAHFAVDALSAFFLVVINLGGAAASLFALG